MDTPVGAQPARNSSGATVGASPTPEAGHGVHLFATLLATANRRTGPGPLRPEAEDIRRAVRIGREGNLVIFVVDASGSMAARDRMAAVTGAALSLLRDAYQRRDKVAVITFRAEGARVVLPPTNVGAYRLPAAGPTGHRRHHSAGRGSAGRPRCGDAGTGP